MDRYAPALNADDDKQPAGPATSLTVGEMSDLAVGFARRQYPLIVMFAICGIALGFVYLFTTPNQYTAHALMVMDTSKSRPAAEPAGVRRTAT